jgi:hypothetical protein
VAVGLALRATHIVRDATSPLPLCADQVLGPDVPVLTLAEIAAGKRPDRFCATCVKRWQRITQPVYSGRRRR